MEPIYENEDGLLKITSQRIKLVAREEMDAEKSAIENDIAGLQAQFNANMQVFATRLDSVNERLHKADELNIPESTPE